MGLPRLYAIVDAGADGGRGISLEGAARELRAAGVALVQYRDKDAGPQEVLRNAAAIAGAFAGADCRLIMNDRADLAVLAGWDGVHVGQEDLGAEGCAARGWSASGGWGFRRIQRSRCGRRMWSGADYVAIGPVFATGDEGGCGAGDWAGWGAAGAGVDAKPIVAIGGITRANARSVIDAGADSVAVIVALLARVRAWRRWRETFSRFCGRTDGT